MSESLSDSASPEDPNSILTEEKPYHSKRPHKKSRTGCKNCKARKVKCDEARPACRSCRLRKTECVYPLAPSTSASTSSNARSSTSPPKTTAPSTARKSSTISKASDDAITAIATSDDPFSPSPPPYDASYDPNFDLFTSPSDDWSVPVTSLDMATADHMPIIVAEPMFRTAPTNDEFDMRLLWFYTTATCSSFSVEIGPNRPIETVMRTRLVQHAFQTPFLMQSLFALSSLHLQSLDQQVDPNRALSYRAGSFEGYRKAVEEGNPETFPALIANSLLLTALSSQQFRDPDGKDLYIIDWMIVWRGIGLMMHHMGFQKLVDSGLGTLFHRPTLDLEASTFAIPNQLLFMISSMPADDMEYPDSQTYYDTLKYLGALYHALNKGINPIVHLSIVTWFTFVPRGFVELGRQHRPRALVILAYYAVFLKISKTIWWIKGIGQRTLQDICRHLGPEYSSLLKIPMLAMGTDDSHELARILLEDPDWTSPPEPNAEDETLAQAIKDLSWVDNQGKKMGVDKQGQAVVLEGPRAGQEPWKN